MKTPEIKPIVLADVTTSVGRICFYYLFDPLNPKYAAKRSVNGEISSLKTSDLGELFAWIGFDALGQELYQSAPMQNRFKIKQVWINKHLLIHSCHQNHLFFIRHNEQWLWSRDPNDLTSVFGEGIFSEINSIAGKGFVEAQIKQIKQDQQIDEQISGTLKELKTLTQKIGEDSAISE